jgi:hypothetical protein
LQHHNLLTDWKPLQCTLTYKKGKGHPITGHQVSRGGVQALERGGWSAPRPGHFTPGKDTVPIVQEAGWAPGPVWTCAKNLGPATGIRSPDRPARSQSLYRLSYPAHMLIYNLFKIFVPIKIKSMSVFYVNFRGNCGYSGVINHSTDCGGP